MGQFFVMHPDNPQPRLISQAASIIQSGGVVIYPTDSGYAIGCQLANKAGLDRIRKIRKLDEKHLFTLLCHNLSELGTYAIVHNPAFRFLKSHTPGPYTFILQASKEVPRRLMQQKRLTIGLRVPEDAIALALLEEMNEPLMSISLSLPGWQPDIMEGQEIYEHLGKQVDLVIDGGSRRVSPTTIVDLVEGEPKVIREGEGGL